MKTQKAKVPPLIIGLFEQLIINIDATYHTLPQQRRQRLRELHIDLITTDMIISALQYIDTNDINVSKEFLLAAASLYSNEPPPMPQYLSRKELLH